MECKSAGFASLLPPYASRDGEKIVEVLEVSAVKRKPPGWSDAESGKAFTIVPDFAAARLYPGYSLWR